MYVCAMYNKLLSSKSSKMSSHSHGMLAERGGMPEWVAERGPHDIALINSGGLYQKMASLGYHKT